MYKMLLKLLIYIYIYVLLLYYYMFRPYNAIFRQHFLRILIHCTLII
jgi:hypothetical protein